MDDPEASPWSAPAAPLEAESALASPPEGEGQPGQEGVAWRGARTGFRLTSYVAGPIAGVIALAAGVPMALGLGAGRGFGVHPALLTAAGFYLGFAMCGVIAGGAVGLVLRLIPARAGWLRAADRPIRLRFWRNKEAGPPLRRRRRWLWVLAGLAWLVLVAAYGVGVYLGGLVDRRLTDAIAAADHDDPDWQVDDLLAHRQPVPDNENSAIVVGEVLSLLPTGWPLPPAPAHVRSAATTTTDVRSAYDRATETQENLRIDAATADVLRRELDEHEEAVHLARTVAGFVQGRHELVLGPIVIDTPLPETQAARTAARLLAADAVLRAHDGDLDEALDSCRAAIGVGRSIGDEPFLISQLVRVASGVVGLKSARRVLGQGEPSDAALAQLQALILDEMNAPLLLYGMRGERAVLVELIRRIGSGELPISALSDQGAKSAAGDARGAIAPWGRLWFDNQRAVALEWMNQAVAIARRPPAEQPPEWKAWEDEFQRVRHSRTGVYAAMLPLLLAPALTPSFYALARYQAELGATALLLAAERHRRLTCAWPASADSMAPEILTNPPVDPFSGRPFVFERLDVRLIIHSVGPNLRDEHGAYEPKHFRNGGPDDVGATAWDVAMRRHLPP